MFSSVHHSLMNCSSKYRKAEIAGRENGKEKGDMFFTLDMLVAFGLLVVGIFASTGVVHIPVGGAPPFYIGAAAAFLLPIALSCATATRA